MTPIQRPTNYSFTPPPEESMCRMPEPICSAPQPELVHDEQAHISRVVMVQHCYEELYLVRRPARFHRNAPRPQNPRPNNRPTNGAPGRAVAPAPDNRAAPVNSSAPTTTVPPPAAGPISQPPRPVGRN